MSRWHGRLSTAQFPCLVPIAAVGSQPWIALFEGTSVTNTIGTPPPANVVTLPVTPKASKKSQKLRSEDKWGAPVIAQGFCIIPALLFRAQRRLGLSATQLAVILQLSEFWWHDGRLPWPKKETIAERLNLSEKQVQRHVRALEKCGYVKRIKRVTRHGQTSNAYDLSGLVTKLQELAPQFAEAQAAKRKVERPGGLKVKPA